VSWRTLSAFAACALATVAVALLVWCRGAARADSAVTDRMVRWWARVWLRASGARVVAGGLESAASAAPCVVVSNHQSNLDPIVHLATLPLSLRVLAKREMFRIWLLGPAMRTIGEFKDGAFVIAVTSQVPVLPVAIHGTGRIWPPGRTAIHGGQVRVVIGSPLPTSGLTQHDVARLRDQAREVIRSAHRDLSLAMSAKAVPSAANRSGRTGRDRG